MTLANSTVQPIELYNVRIYLLAMVKLRSSHPEVKFS